MNQTRRDNHRFYSFHLPTLIFSFLLSGLVTVVALRAPSISKPAAFMAGIFVLAALLWTTEALPLFATSLLIIALEILFLANPGGWEILATTPKLALDYKTVFAWAADPVLVLFFGGFLLARAAIKTGLDQAMSGQILKRFGTRPRFILMGVMGVTALFSMWMSNTATTAMMIALIAPIVSQVAPGDRFRKALILSVPFAANIGGLGTPISSPPNAVALGFLRNVGIHVDFLEWMLVAIPLMALMLLFTWILLGIFFRPTAQGLRLQISETPIDRTGWFVVVVFFLTVLLWLTDAWHGLPASVVALVPVVAFTAGRVLNREDLNHIDWATLILIGGGIALGAGMQASGLDQVILGILPRGGDSLPILAAILVFATMTFSTFMSNTAAANLLLPIGVSAGLALGGDSTLCLVFSIALSASLAMVLPISTPPNAIAYSQGEFSRKEMAFLGAMIGGLGAGLIVGFAGLILRLFGLAA